MITPQRRELRMARTDERRTIAVVDVDDCPLCGGRLVVKRAQFENVWGFRNGSGNVAAVVNRYYCHCSVCGEVTGWRFSAEEAKNDYLTCKRLVGRFLPNGKYKVIDRADKKAVRR